ncbi:MAG: (d)CMP kinase [Tepidamorphaceae bacterium]|nr:(d)CMP kinase [Rhodobiaceae bacterium]MCC0049497.1 (d)CMP kinase [Rhodobiaceae bacterium]
MIIAVDGPAAAGKGTLTRALAEHYGLPRLDTGVLYRAVAATLLADCLDPADTEVCARVAGTLDLSRFADADLRTSEVSQLASVVSSQPDVRKALLMFQRAFAARPPGAVLDGRDIGTVVCPDADVKLFVTASTEARARRRWLELRQAGTDIDLQSVFENIRDRDERDSSRGTSPMRCADDAHLLDTTEMDIEAAFRAAVSIIDAVWPGTGG